MDSKFEKLLIKYIKLWRTTDLSLHFIIISVLSFLYIDYFLRITTGFINSLLSNFIILPFLGILFYLAVSLLYFHFKDKARMIISMIFTAAFCFVILGKEFDNFFFSIIKDIIYAPLIFSVGYLIIVFLASQPDESFPTFKKILKKLKPW